MEKRFLRDLEVSPVGTGCMAFSHGYGVAPEKSYSIEAIRKAYEYGCTFYDTAEVYGTQQFYPGHNEEIVGEAIEPFRKNIVLATKLFIGTEEAAEKGVYTAVKDHLVASMKKLRTDYVDLYYLHRVNVNVPVEEVADAMGKLIGEGLVRGWGLSQVGADVLDRAHKVFPVSAVQNLYNMLERDCEADIFPYCLENNIGVVPFSPVASGLLSGKITVNTEFEKVDDVRTWVPQLTKENIAGNTPIVEMLSKFAAEKDATPAQLAMAWMLHKYPNVVPIPGSKNQGRIIENLGSWNVKLSDSEFAQLEKDLDSFEVYGHRGNVQYAGK